MKMTFNGRIRTFAEVHNVSVTDEQQKASDDLLRSMQCTPKPVLLPRCPPPIPPKQLEIIHIGRIQTSHSNALQTPHNASASARGHPFS
jgi:hypothetical protein